MFVGPKHFTTSLDISLFIIFLNNLPSTLQMGTEKSLSIFFLIFSGCPNKNVVCQVQLFCTFCLFMIFAYIDLSNSRQRIFFYDGPQGRLAVWGECERVGECGNAGKRGR